MTPTKLPQNIQPYHSILSGTSINQNLQAFQLLEEKKLTKHKNHLRHLEYYIFFCSIRVINWKSIQPIYTLQQIASSSTDGQRKQSKSYYQNCMYIPNWHVRYRNRMFVNHTK